MPGKMHRSHVYAVSTPSSSPSSAGSAMSRSSSIATSSSPDFAGIHRLVIDAIQSNKVIVKRIESLPGHLHRLYVLILGDGARLVLKCTPPNRTKLLRHEQRSLGSEGKALELFGQHIQLPIPVFYKFDAQGYVISAPYILSSFVYGASLAEISAHLSVIERTRIDKSLGSMLRSISSLRGPSFGSTHRVFSGHGSGTWREAYRSMLESILRDGEDALVSLPYESIRSWTNKKSSVLDDITEPRLSILNFGDPHNVLVDGRSRQVSGLLDFGHTVWGDPMMAAVFSEASAAFLEGFGVSPTRTPNEVARQLLYRIYRATVEVVTLHVRPQQTVSDIEPRRVLNMALNELARS